MSMTTAQRATLAAGLRAETDPAMVAALAARNDTEIARLCNLPESPTFWVYRSSVPEGDFTRKPSVDGTTWSWPAIIARSAGEQFGWQRLFADGPVDATQANVRQAFTDIFSGTQNNAPAQRAHCQAVARRAVTWAERLFSSGTGSTASPGVTTWEGEVTIEDVGRALNDNP